VTIKITASTMGVSSPASVAAGTRYYRYKGNKPLAKEAGAPPPQNAKAMTGRRARVAEYKRLRLDEGLTKEQAAERIGISRSAGRYYELEFQAEQQGGGRDG